MHVGHKQQMHDKKVVKIIWISRFFGSESVLSDTESSVHNSSVKSYLRM